MADAPAPSIPQVSLLERLKKIKALAEGGSEGERENAQHLLDELCRKYGVTLDQLADTQKTWHSFPVKGEWERELFQSVIIHVLQTRQIRHTKSANRYECELTTAQAIDVRDCWEHFRAAWRAQVSDFLVAFIYKNRIIGPPSTKPSEPNADAEAMAKRISALMAGMTSKPWEKRLRLSS